MNERDMQIAEETRLREDAQHWATRLKEARDAGKTDVDDIETRYRQAVRAHDGFASGFDHGDDE